MTPLPPFHRRSEHELRVLVFALFGADAELTREILAGAGVMSEICPDIERLGAAIAEGAAAVLVTEEALVTPVVAALVEILDRQPSWSDLPVIVSAAERELAADLSLSDRINVVTIERPIRVRALISTVRNALRARTRQYETRDLLESREQIARDLRRVEAEMRALVENLSALAWTAGPDGHIYFYNRRWYDYTGTTFEEMEGWGWEKVHHPEMLPKVVAAWSASLESGAPFEMEFPLRGKDGVFRWFLTRATPLRDQDGVIVRWIGVNFDIDDKRRIATEQDLHTRRTALLARASELLSASLDVEKSLGGLAEAILEWMGTSVSIELLDERGDLGPPIVLADRDPELAARARESRAAHPDDAKERIRTTLTGAHGARASLEAATALGPGASHISTPERASSTLTAPLVSRDAPIGVLVVGSRERTYGEADLALVEQLATRAAIAVDNARLYAAAQRDRDRTARLQGLAAALSAARTTNEVADVLLSEGIRAASAPRGLVCVLAAGDTVLETLLARGYPAEAVALWARLPMAGRAPLTDVVRSGEPAFYESSDAVLAKYPDLSQSRSLGDEALAALPLAVGGRTLGALALVYDTRRAFSEEDRLQMQAIARLSAQAMDRALLFELAQRERTRAEEANRAKDEFLAVVSHELRTPLSAMLGWTRMLRTGSLDATKREKALATIERNALAQTQLIEDLLDITRVVTGKLRLSVAPTDLRAVIEAAVETMRPAADAKEVRLGVVLDPAVPTIEGDADRLQQIVWNLLSNALKFTPAGGHVEVRLAATVSHLEIAVEDSGVGVPPEFLPHIFERFRQADASSTRTFGGLGLGLAIVQHLVELHGGTIAASNNAHGPGARFVVRIPLAPRAAPPPPLRIPERGRAAKRGVSSAADGDVSGLRVLVVDDEDDARELLVAVLEDHGAVVQSAESAREGLARLVEWKPDVLLSDIGMPITDGYAFIASVRALPPDAGGRTPAVALTAFARTEDRRKAITAGFDLHVAKPIEPAELVSVLARLGRPHAQPGRSLEPLARASSAGPLVVERASMRSPVVALAASFVLVSALACGARATAPSPPPQPPSPHPHAAPSAPPVASAAPSSIVDAPVAPAREEPKPVSLGAFVRSLAVPVRSLALGEPRVAALGDVPWMLENGVWKQLSIPERVRPKAGERDDGRIFFGRDDRPRIMGTRTRSDGAAQLYLRFRNGAFADERGEIAKLGHPPAAGMFGVLGHADPEVVCKIGDECIIKRRTGWKMIRAGSESPRIELHGGVAWALLADGVARLDDDRAWTTFRPREPLRDVGGAWGRGDEVWIAETGAARLHHLENGAWTTIDAPFPSPRGMAGASRDDLWLAGATGLAHFDGALWSRVEGPSGPLAEVYGRGSEIWAGGESGVWVRTGAQEAR